MNTLQKTNILIAEYEGWRFMNDDLTGDYPNGYMMWDTEESFSETDVRYLNYHDDWNDLIPVAKRVRDELEDYNGEEDVDLVIFKLIRVSSSFDISQLYNAVIEGIIFLNNNKI